MSMLMGAAPPRGRPPSPTDDRLDQPPMAPVDQAGATAGLTGAPVGADLPGGGAMGTSGGGLGQLTGLGGSASPASAMQGFVERVAQLDQELLSLAQSAPVMGPKLGQARTLIQQAMAEFLQSAVLAQPPTRPGGWPGGGFGSPGAV